jgi:peptidoglycan/xylan/chitin deacetylase (PgdA/CDA1 family)
MYHSVADCTDDPYRITVTPERLDGQLAWLRRRGLTGVSVTDLLTARARGESHGLVGLTFDDGYATAATRPCSCCPAGSAATTPGTRWARANRC